MAIVANEMIRNLLKTVYLSGVTNNKYQNSPVLSKIKKENWGSGKEIKYAAQYGNGGNFSSDYALLSTASNQGSVGGVRNLEWTMDQGYMVGLFDINQPEILTTAEERGAYMKALANKMAGCFDGMSKTLAMYLYGGKYGVIDQVAPASGDSVSIIAGSNTLPITSAGSIKMDVGTKFVIASAGAANKALPKSNLLNALMTVTAIDDESVTFTSTAAVTAYRGDYIELYGARNGTSIQGIEGLAEIVPAYGDRDSSDTRWSDYIDDTFRGVDRSVAVSRLAGQFVKAEATGDTRLTDALVKLLKKTKRAGGMNNVVIINDETWDAVGDELGIQRNLWQATNSGDNKNRFTAGYSELATAFGDAFIGRTVIDPYCTEGFAYMLDTDDLTFYDLGNVSKVIDNVANDQLGKPTIEGTGDQGISDQPGSKINMDKLFTITEGSKGSFGPALEIAAHVYGNFSLRKTASAGVAHLV
jgi:hypothetical protein